MEGADKLQLSSPSFKSIDDVDYYHYLKLFDDHLDGDRILISPLSIVRMRVDKGELPCSDLRSESKTQSNQTRSVGLGGDGFLGYYQEIVPGWSKTLTCSRFLSLTRHHQDLEIPVLRWNTESHTFVAVWGEFTPTLEDLARQTMLSLFVEANTMGIILEGDDQTKLKYLTFDMAASKALGKLTSATWLRLFDEGDDS